MRSAPSLTGSVGAARLVALKIGVLGDRLSRSRWLRSSSGHRLDPLLPDEIRLGRAPDSQKRIDALYTEDAGCGKQILFV